MRAAALALLLPFAALADAPYLDWPHSVDVSGVGQIVQGGGELSCDTSLSLCPNPKSTLILDTRIFFSVARGGNRDDDGTMWTGPDTANDQYDFINDSTTATASNTATVYVRSVTNTEDTLFCRDTAASYSVCSTGATCVSTIQGVDDSIPLVWCDDTTGLCEGLGASAYSGCNSATNNITFVGGPTTANAGTIQHAMPDGVSPGSLLSKLVAQTILAGTVELLEYPVSTTSNLIANGHATSNATGWTDVGAGTAAYDAAEAIPANMQNGNWYNGGVALTGRTLATDALLSPTMTTVVGKWYVARGFARLNSTATTDDIVVQAIDASAGTALATQVTYRVVGSKYKTLTSGTTDLDRECYGGCYFIVKFLASDVDTQISIGSNAGTGNIYADDWIGMEAPTDQLSLTPLFPNNGGIALRVEGDARANSSSEIAGAIETAVSAGVPRADFALLDDLFTANTLAIGGRTAQSLVTLGFPSITLGTSGGRYVVVQLGLNDIGSRTPAQVVGDYQDITNKIRQVGGRPILVLESPFRGNTTLTTCESGSENCTTTIDEIADLLKHSTTGVLHQ